MKKQTAEEKAREAMLELVDGPLLDRCARMLGYADAFTAGRNDIFCTLRCAHEAAIEKDAEYQEHANDPFYEQKDTGTRDEPFTVPGFIAAYHEIRKVANRDVSEEGAFVERTREELDEFEITNDCGIVLNWLTVANYLNYFISKLVALQNPMSEQEYFNRHNEIYRIAHEKEFYFNGTNLVH